MEMGDMEEFAVVEAVLGGLGEEAVKGGVGRGEGLAEAEAVRGLQSGTSLA